MCDKAVNLSENFKSSRHHKRLQYGKFDVYTVKIGECWLNLIHGFGFRAAQNLTQILRAFAPIKIILSKKQKKLKFKVKFEPSERRLAKKASQVLGFKTISADIISNYLYTR